MHQTVANSVCETRGHEVAGDIGGGDAHYIQADAPRVTRCRAKTNGAPERNA